MLSDFVGSSLFNIFLCDIFLEDENNHFANYIDDTTPYSVGSAPTEVLEIYLVLLTVYMVCYQSNESKR